MITRIGLAAGDIWNYLEGHARAAYMSDMAHDLRKERDIILMSIGWLAREGHVILEGEGPNFLVKLVS